MEVARRVAARFLKGELAIKAIPSGHINRTYLVSSASEAFILQRVNTDVFRDPFVLDSNLKILTSHLEKSDYPYEVALLLQGEHGETLIEDEGHWRALTYISDAHEESARTPGLLAKTGQAFGHYVRYLEGVDPAQVQPAIKDFHNPSFRFEQLMQVLGQNKEREQQAQNLVEHAMAMSGILTEHDAHLPNIPLRITHNDAKIGNVLFDDQNRVKAILDLDTTMPGYLMHDFGDMCRSMCNPTTEDNQELTEVSFDAYAFSAIAGGYMSALDEIITDDEILSLLTGVKSVVYMQFIRFLTDYLNGDRYYKVSFPDQNLWRSKVQMKLLLDFLQKENELGGILESIVNA